MMQTNWLFIGFLLLILLTVLITFMLRRWSDVAVKCPTCDSAKVAETSRKTVDSRTIEQIGSGTGAGGDIRLQLDFESNYHCKKCGANFILKHTETQ